MQMSEDDMENEQNITFFRTLRRIVMVYTKWCKYSLRFGVEDLGNFPDFPDFR